MAAVAVTGIPPWDNSQNQPQHHEGIELIDDDGMLWPTQPSTSYSLSAQQDYIGRHISHGLYNYETLSHLDHAPQSHTPSYELTSSSSSQLGQPYFDADSSCPRTVPGHLEQAFEHLNSCREGDVYQNPAVSNSLVGSIAGPPLSPFDFGTHQSHFVGGSYLPNGVMESVEKTEPISDQAPMMHCPSDVVVPNLRSSATPDDMMIDADLDDSNAEREQPYAKLIYQCLKEAPERTMVLKDIYKWFELNTDKSCNQQGQPQGKGWQNSIRHNLSMNAVSIVTINQRRSQLIRTGFQKG